MSERLDILLVNKGYAKSREKAKAVIKDGMVYINDIRQTKPSAMISDDSKIEIKGEVCKFVSRGGYKLEKAIIDFSIDLTGLKCIDIGASTGGFTDCMLKNGADTVYAVDVGHDQLEETLLNDERVVSMEGVNFRYVSADDFDISFDFAGCDVSFISLRHILPAAYNILSDKGKMVCLIKPQFEAGKEHLSKKGVVKDKKIHIKIIRELIDFSIEVGFNVLNLTYSPIKGPEGNTEYLLYLTKDNTVKGVFVNAANTVSEAFSE